MIQINIKMPQNCGECLFCYHRKDAITDSHWCLFRIEQEAEEMKSGIDTSRHHKNCPLIEVTE